VRRLFRALIAIIVIVLAGYQAAGAVVTGDARLEHARRLFRTAELAMPDSPVRVPAYSEAEAIASQVVAEDATNAEAHFLLFATRGRRLLHDVGKPSMKNFWKYARANEHLDRALELDPRHAHALAAKGGILLDLPSTLGGSVAAARELLERAVELNPTGVGTRVTLARALLKDGESDDARRHLLAAAHYACRKGEKEPLAQVERLLSSLAAAS
jgi:Flp pilus assembly protein TadD